MADLILRAPNLAMLCLLAIPFTSLLVGALVPLGVPLPPGDRGALLWVSLFALAAAVPLAARLRAAPPVGTALAFLLLAGGYRTGSPQLMHPFSLLVLAAAALVWASRGAFHRDFAPDRLGPQVAEGLRMLLRSDPCAAPRALAGSVLLLAVELVLFAGFRHPRWPSPDYPTFSHVNLGVGALLIASLGLIASALAVREEPEPAEARILELEEEPDWLTAVGGVRFLPEGEEEPP